MFRAGCEHPCAAHNSKTDGAHWGLWQQRSHAASRVVTQHLFFLNHANNHKTHQWNIQLVFSLPRVNIASIVTVLSVCVCEAWLFWFTEILCWMSVSLKRAGRPPAPPPLHFVRAWTQTHSHHSACPCLSFGSCNRLTDPELNTHPTHKKTTRPTRCFPSDFVLAASGCVSRHNSNRTTFESLPILRKPVGFPGANEMPARQMDMREPQSDPTLGSK